MSIPSSKEREQMTPMMRQYFELKEQSPGAILFFRMGDFYEIFGADAEEVAPVLQLVLTSRERGDQQRIPFCGVPHHSAKNYWIKLLLKGYKIAIADQVEDPAAAKGLVRREIIKILSPGCIDELEGLDSEAPNYLLGIYEEPSKQKWSVALIDVSTGEFRLGEASSFEDVFRVIERYQPREILTRRFFMQSLKSELEGRGDLENVLIEPLSEAVLRDKDEQKHIIDFVFQTKTTATLPCGNVVGGDSLAAAMLTHIRSLHISLSHFMTIRPIYEPEVMILDETVVADLELFITTRRRQSEGSLFAEINRTRSPMGARFLRHALGHPLLDHKRITERQHAVRSLVGLDGEAFDSLRNLLRLPDLERLITKLVNRNISPQELAAIRECLVHADLLIDRLAVSLDEGSELILSLAEELRHFHKVFGVLDDALAEAPSHLGSGHLVFKEGYCPELDELNRLAHHGHKKLRDYEDSLREATGISSIKIKNHKTFGYLIEVTKANVNRVPSTFIRRQTMVNGERFVTIELKELNDLLMTAQDKAILREAQLYSELVERVITEKEALRRVSQGLAYLDMLYSFTCLAREENYVEPELSSDGHITIHGGRHPVVYRLVGPEKYNANNLEIRSEARHVLITGPNMAGKSTIMRQVALICILHQTGCYVPALSASLPLFDRIFTRVGASDDLARGLSTFMVEMNEASHILRMATQRSLVILDEVGRGTSTQDGLAIATAILEDLVTRVKCYSMFATHYHELVPFAEKLGGIACIQPEVRCSGEDIVFTHNIIPGASGHSYGLEVARHAGIPQHVIDRARAVLHNLEPTQDKMKRLAEAAQQAPVLPDQPPLEQAFQFTGLSENRLREISDKLLGIKIHRTTPLQALNLLNDLRVLAENKVQEGLFDL